MEDGPGEVHSEYRGGTTSACAAAPWRATRPRLRRKWDVSAGATEAAGEDSLPTRGFGLVMNEPPR